MKFQLRGPGPLPPPPWQSLCSKQARSQDLEKGGLFWKSEKCANDLDSNFHWPWISFRWFVRNLRRNVSERSEIQRFFPPKIRWSPKKKGLRQNSEWFFSQFRKFKRLRGGSFRMGGLFSIFHRKSASKAQKTCVFAYFTSKWGGLEPPPWLRYWLQVKKQKRFLQIFRDVSGVFQRTFNN